MKFTYRFAKTADELNKQIDSAIDSAKTMKQRVQVAAVSILFHAEDCGDYTGAARLIDGLGDGVNQDALVEFFVLFGGLQVDTKNGGFNDWLGREHIREHFQTAKETPWFSLKKMTPYKGFDADAALCKLATQIQNAKKKMAKLEDGSPLREEFTFEVQESSIKTLLNMVDFEAIVAEEEEEEVAA